MRHRTLFLTAALATLCVLATASRNTAAAQRPGRQSQPVAGPSQSRRVILEPVADTWVRTNRDSVVTPPAPANHGAEATLVTWWHDVAGYSTALVRFDLSAMRPDTEVTAAHLELYVVSAETGYVPQPEAPTSVHRVDADWSELQLMDGNEPPFARETSRTVPVAGTWAVWDVTPLAQSWASGAVNHGLALTTREAFVFTTTFASRESETKPRLVLELDPANSTETPTPPPPMADLTGRGSEGCYGRGLSVTVRNRGAADAGLFAVGAQGGTPRWSVAELGAGSSVDLAPMPWSGGPLFVDVDDQVPESDEGNNRVVIAVPGCLGLLFPWLGRP